MATDAVPTQDSGGRIIEAWWFGFLVRSGLALLALWTLSFAADRYRAFGLDASANFRFDDWLWFSWVGAMVGAGFLFGLATWLPFAKARFLPSRLLLAALALLPLAQFWWVLIQGHTIGRVAGTGLLVRRGADPVRLGCSCGSRDRVGLQGQTPPPGTRVTSDL